MLFLFCILPRDAVKLVLLRNYADILSRPLTSTMDETMCSPHGKTRDSQPIVAQHVNCRGWWYLSPLSTTQQSDQDYRMFFLAVFPRTGGSAAASEDRWLLSLITVVRNAKESGFQRNRASRSTIYRRYQKSHFAVITMLKLRFFSNIKKLFKCLVKLMSVREA